MAASTALQSTAPRLAGSAVTDDADAPVIGSIRLVAAVQPVAAPHNRAPSASVEIDELRREALVPGLVGGMAVE